MSSKFKFQWEKSQHTVTQNCSKITLIIHREFSAEWGPNVSFDQTTYAEFSEAIH